MKEPTMKEVLKLVSFELDSRGEWAVQNVNGNVMGNVYGYVRGNVDSVGNVKGNVWGNVVGSVFGNVKGNVFGGVGGYVAGNVKGSVFGNVCGTINRRQWQFVETKQEKIIRLIREGNGEEAIKVLQEGE